MPVHELFKDDRVETVALDLTGNLHADAADAQDGLVRRGLHHELGADEPDDFLPCGLHGLGDKVGGIHPWDGAGCLGDVNRVDESLVWCDAERRARACEDLCRSNKKSRYREPVVFLDRVDIGAEPFIVEREYGLLSRRQQPLCMMPHAAEEECGSLRPSADDPDVLGAQARLLPPYCLGPVVRGQTPIGWAVASDPFDILGLSPRFDLDEAEIQRAYLRRVAAVHPDSMGLGGGSGDEAAVELNAARAVLSNAEQRAEALLARLGGKPAFQDKSLPPGYLAEIMELREEAEIQLAGDADGTARAAWRARAAERRESHVASLRALFANASVGGMAALTAIRMELNAMRYTERLIEQLDPAYRQGSERHGAGGGRA